MPYGLRHFILLVIFIAPGFFLTAAGRPACAQSAAAAQETVLWPVILSNQSYEINADPKSIFIVPDPGKKYQFNSIIDMAKNGQILSFASAQPYISVGAKGDSTWVVIPVVNKSNHEVWSFSFGSSQDGRLGFAQKAILYEPTSGQSFFNTTANSAAENSGAHLASEVPIALKQNVISYMIFYIEGRKGSLTTFNPTFRSYGENSNFQILSPQAKSFYLAAIFILMTGFFFSRDYSLIALSLMWLLIYIYRTFLDQYFVIDTFFGQIVTPSYRLAQPLLLFSALWLHPAIKGKYPASFFLGIALIFVACGFMGIILPVTSPVIGAIFSYIPFLGISIVTALVSWPIALSQPRENLGGIALISATFIFSGAWSALESLHSVSSLYLMLNTLPWLTAVISVLSSLLHLRYTDSLPLRDGPLPAIDLDISDENIREAREASEHTRLLQVLDQERSVMKTMQDAAVRQTEEMKRAKESADEANMAKSAFLAVVSHEIRTPMTGIMGMVRLILDTSLSREQKEFANTIQDSGEALLSLLNDILDFEKIESGKLELEKASFDLKRLLKGIHTLMSGHAAAKNVELVLDIDKALPDFVIGDPTRLRQVLLNLVNNAIKFTARGAVTLHVKNLSDADSSRNVMSQIYFGVQDSGIGISAEAQKKIFTPFAQADASINRKFGGTGLGLTICKRLIDAMGSSIGINSREGEGSTFFFTLQLPISKMEDRQQKETSLYDKDIRKMRILVVDDNGINQKVIQSLLNKGGHQSIVASNVDDALKEISRSYFDLILMDIELPGKSGVEGTQIIRALSDSAKAIVPVVAMTGNVSPSDVKNYLANGMNDFIGKPVMPETLNQLLSRASRNEFANNVTLPAPIDGKKNKNTQTVESSAFTSGEDEEDEFASAVREFEQAEAKPAAETIYLDEVLVSSLINSLGVAQTTDLVKDFYAKAEELIGDLRKAAKEGKTENLRSRAHELKGMAGNFGFKALAEISTLLEKNASVAPQSDLTGWAESLPQIYAGSVSEMSRRLKK